MTADNLSIDIPRELVKLSGLSINEIASYNIEIWVNELYSAGKISLSKASELLNLKVDEFLERFRKKRLVRIGGPQSIDEAITDEKNIMEVLEESSRK